jgi:Helix-turn-helix domain
MKTPDKSSGVRSQSEQILAYLQAGRTLTELEALNLFNCMSLAQRIYDLRRHGHRIISTPITTQSGKRIAQYSLGKIEEDGVLII